MAQPAPLVVKEPAFSFMSLVQKTGTLGKSSRSKTIDPLTAAKHKILAALDTQEGFVRDLMDGRPLLKAKGGEKTVSTWFSKQNDGWWTSIRYGQVSLQIGPNKTDTDMLIGGLKDLLNFYAAVKTAIGAGEMDDVIGTVQEQRSAALKAGRKVAWNKR